MGECVYNIVKAPIGWSLFRDRQRLGGHGSAEAALQAATRAGRCRRSPRPRHRVAKRTRLPRFCEKFLPNESENQQTNPDSRRNVS
jgi:hypothetical protein